MGGRRAARRQGSGWGVRGGWFVGETVAIRDAGHVAVRRAYVRHDYAFTPISRSRSRPAPSGKLRLCFPDSRKALPLSSPSPSFFLFSSGYTYVCGRVCAGFSFFFPPSYLFPSRNSRFARTSPPLFIPPSTWSLRNLREVTSPYTAYTSSLSFSFLALLPNMRTLYFWVLTLFLFISFLFNDLIASFVDEVKITKLSESEHSDI